MTRELLMEYIDNGKLIDAAVYLRKSRAEEHMSLEDTLSRHKSALLAYADRHSYRIVDIYEEVVSGESLFARPQMLKLMEAVSAGKYHAVLCMDMQRLGRGGMYDQGFILDTFKEAETLIVTPERLYDLTKEIDEQAAEMETFLSRGEYRLITKRLSRGKLQSVNNGAYMANPPFGYRKVRIGRLPSLEIVPEEADCVRKIFQMYADGNGCTRIEQAINAMGYHGRRGSNFNRNTIRLILDNPVYIGKIRWNKTSTVKTGVGAERTKKVVYNTGEKIQILDGHHPAIISQELWDAVQAKRKSRYFYVDNKHISSPLAGLVHCAKCGKGMNMQGQSKGVPYLVCHTKGCCAGAKFEFVEQAVLKQLQELADGLEVKIKAGEKPDTGPLESVLSALESQQAKLDARRNRLYVLLEDGTYTKDLFTERREVLESEEATLQAALDDARSELQKLTSRNDELQLAKIRNVLEHYHGADLPARKSMLQSIVSDIRYTKLKKTKPADFTLDLSLIDFL